MYERSAAFAAANRDQETPLVVLGLRTPAGRRLYGRHAPAPEQTGFRSRVGADGTWLADGRATAGEASVPVLSRRRDVLSLGDLAESLSARREALLGLLSGGRAGELTATLDNAVEADGHRHFAALVATEGVVGGSVDLEFTAPGVPARDAFRRFAGRVRRLELSRERAVLRLRAV